MSEHITVVRVEHDTETNINGTALGPYSNTTTSTADVRDVTSGLRAADPERAAALQDRDGLLAGFTSGQHVSDYFTTDELELLALSGYVMRDYLVPASEVDARQGVVTFRALAGFPGLRRPLLRQ